MIFAMLFNQMSRSFKLRQTLRLKISTELNLMAFKTFRFWQTYSLLRILSGEHHSLAFLQHWQHFSTICRRTILQHHETNLLNGWKFLLECLFKLIYKGILQYFRQITLLVIIDTFIWVHNRFLNWLHIIRIASKNHLLIEPGNFLRFGAQNGRKSALNLLVATENIDWRQWGDCGCDNYVRLVGYGGVVDWLELGRLILNFLFDFNVAAQIYEGCCKRLLGLQVFDFWGVPPTNYFRFKYWWHRQEVN